MTVPALARRAATGRQLLSRAERFVAGVPSEVAMRAAVVIGSVARGDFHRGSDVDVVVVAERLADRLLDRYEQLGARPGRVEPHPWTPAEWHRRLARRDPMAVEATVSGLWLFGQPDDIPIPLEPPSARS